MLQIRLPHSDMGRRAEIELLEHLESRLQQHKHTEDQTHYLSRQDVNILVRWGNIVLFHSFMKREEGEK